MTIDLAAAAVKWQLKIANLNPTTANGDLETDPPEVDDLLLVLGYESEVP